MRRKFESYEEAIKYLEDKGRLEYFGKIVARHPGEVTFDVYNIHLHDGRTYGLYVYADGLVEITR